MRLGKLVWRGLRLRCPHCGHGRLFRDWFRMAQACARCDADLRREPGFFLGAIYVNYGLTALILAVLYPALRFGTSCSRQMSLAICLAVAVLFPVWWFRYARSLWMSMDLLFDPRDSE